MQFLQSNCDGVEKLAESAFFRFCCGITLTPQREIQTGQRRQTAAFSARHLAPVEQQTPDAPQLL
jgi:hypothetical protein